MEESGKLILIAVAAFGLAIFIYAAYISDPPLLKLPNIQESLESEIVKSQKVDPKLLSTLSVDPKKKVRMFVSLEGINATELEKQGLKIIKKGRYANYAVVEGDYTTLNKLISTQGVSKVYKDGVVKAVEIDLSQLGDVGKIPIKPVVQGVGWNLEAIKADVVHQSNITGRNAVIAILDTGVNHNLTDLDDHYLTGYDFVHNDNEPDDQYGHGTKCASIAVAEGETYKGVAPSASYIALKVLNDEGWGNWSDIIAALEWCLDYVNSGHRIDVISMSLGADLAPLELQQVCDELYAKGVILVAASGNEGSDVSLYPARYDSVISVAANDILLNVASFSNGEAYVSAPGVQVPVLAPDGNIYFGDGTSFATPHVAGVLALVESEKDITPQQAFELLKISTDEVNDPYNKVEYGQIDAVKAVNNALNLDLEGEEHWYDIIKEPQIQIVVGLLLLVGIIKFYVLKGGGGLVDN